MSILDIATAVGPSVAGLTRGARGGSGVVVAADRVLTLAHHLRDDELELRLGDAAPVRARLLATDADLDLALLAADTGDAPAVRFAGDRELPIGTPVWALGDPGGEGLRVTAGALASAPRSVRGRRGRPVRGVLEHTAPLPARSGGGPLVDADGAVLGLNALRTSGGLILALPATEISARLEALLEGRPASPRRLGVALVPPRAARRLRRAVGLDERDGLLVAHVQDDTPASAGGVRQGDLLIAFGGRPLASADDLYAALDAAPLGRPTPLAVVRGADELELTVTLPEASSAGAAT